MVYCCGSSFLTQGPLRDHRGSTRHRRRSNEWICSICDFRPQTAEALSQHQTSKNDRPHKNARCIVPVQVHRGDNHESGSQSKHDVVCGECLRIFASQKDLQIHQMVQNHASEFNCCDCDKVFATTIALERHRHTNVETPRYCTECAKGFMRKKDLENHMGSLAHNPLSTIFCRCKAQFKCPSSLLQHLECGSCDSGMSRQLLNIVAFRGDKSGVFTTTSRSSTPTPSHTSVILDSKSDTTAPGLLTPSSDTDSDAGALLYTPQSGSVALSPLRLEALSLQENDGESSISLRCPRCPPSRQPFVSAQSLRNHLNSAAHAPSIFHCPISFDLAKAKKINLSKAQRRSFSTLSGLSAHVESGACGGKRGKVSIKTAVEFMEHLVLDLGIGIKLLE